MPGAVQADEQEEGTMKREKLNVAAAEAERFIARLDDLKNVRFDAPDEMHPRETAAVRRASMDLTRALADLRRPG